MADAAVILGWNVDVRLRRGDTGVMAGSTTIRIDPGVAVGDSCKSREVADIVAVRTVQACGHVPHRLAGTDLTVVAGRTVAGIYADMLENRIAEVRGVVADGTIFGGWQMTAELADGDHVVVARLAPTGDIEVIICACFEAPWRVAEAAVVDGGHVVGRFTAR